MKCWVVSTRSIAAWTSSLMVSYCRVRSSIGTGSRWVAELGLTSDCGEVVGITKARFYREFSVDVCRLKRRVLARVSEWRLLAGNRRSRDCECNGDLSIPIESLGRPTQSRRTLRFFAHGRKPHPNKGRWARAPGYCCGVSCQTVPWLLPQAEVVP